MCSRIDWKYLLCLELTDTGFHHTVLSEFRTRLINEEAERLIFDQLLLQCHNNRGWLKARTRQRTGSTHVLAAIRAVTRLECVGETMRAALNALAVAAPDWLLGHSQDDWVDRYSERIEDYHLPKSKSKRVEQAELYGRDGLRLLNDIFDSTSPAWLRQIPAIETLHRVWVQQYYCCDNEIHWREYNDSPLASVMINSPYEPDAHYAKKCNTSWVGYKVHLSVTCEPDELHVITNVKTTSRPDDDRDVTETIHTSMEANNVLPSKHIVDTGYLDAELLVPTLASTQSRPHSSTSPRNLPSGKLLFFSEYHHRQTRTPILKLLGDFPPAQLPVESFRANPSVRPNRPYLIGLLQILKQVPDQSCANPLISPAWSRRHCSKSPCRFPVPG